MLTQATQAAIAILHDISTGIYFRSANFRFTEEEWENLFHKLEEGHIILFAEYASRSKDRRAQPGYADASDRNQNIRLVTV